MLRTLGELLRRIRLDRRLLPALQDSLRIQNSASRRLNPASSRSWMFLDATYQLRRIDKRKAISNHTKVTAM